jgi:hypothetical protein
MDAFPSNLLTEYSSNEKTSRQHNNWIQKKQLKKVATTTQKRKQTNLVYIIYTTITHHFSELLDWMREIDDTLKKAYKYELAAHLMACLACSFQDQISK